MPPSAAIRFSGARTHNLKDISGMIPHGQLTVIAGPSGSGKSSLAYDTLFAEGQRQYLETLSAWARQKIQACPRPDVDFITGLPPTVAVRQRGGRAYPRGTVATMTDISDYLALLCAHVGEPRCPNCGTSLRRLSANQIVERVAALPANTRAMLLAPLDVSMGNAFGSLLQAVRRAGFVRMRVDGEVHGLETLAAHPPEQYSRAEAVVDRVVIKEGVESRLRESVQLALKEGQGQLIVCYQESEGSGSTWQEATYSTTGICAGCGRKFEDLTPRHFNFNSPQGACPTCDGLGVVSHFVIDLVLDIQAPLPSAVLPWQSVPASKCSPQAARWADFLECKNLSSETCFSELDATHRDMLWNGKDTPAGFPGLRVLLETEFAELPSSRRAPWKPYRREVTCEDCGGTRLRAEARACWLGDASLEMILNWPLNRVREFFCTLEAPAHQAEVWRPLLREIRNRLETLDQLGLGYLHLGRAANSLSGGEWQRIRLTAALGSPLSGVCYVLDEPSLGLHPRDNQRLVEAIRELCRWENTVIVVEHDATIMAEADFLLDVGPAAGSRGGEIVAAGPAKQVLQDPASLTAACLADRTPLGKPAVDRLTKQPWLEIRGCRLHNLKNVTPRFPLRAISCVTGVSGSGKSSLTNDTLMPALINQAQGTNRPTGEFDELRCDEPIDRVISVDQSPLASAARSTPATFVGIFDEIRRLFAATKEARQYGYRAGRFSFNSKGGRCEECQGLGMTTVELDFLPPLETPCAVCGGSRYNAQTRRVTFHGLSIAEVLRLEVEQAAEIFANVPSVVGPLRVLQSVGLGYLRLGQSAATLSGGEAQRIKLAAELGKRTSGHTVYLLDEPTTGLHFVDVRRLFDLLRSLTEAGHTVIIVEHHVDIMRSADWIVDLGPEGGEEGGQIMAMGTPAQVAAQGKGPTAAFLQAD